MSLARRALALIIVLGSFGCGSSKPGGGAGSTTGSVASGSIGGTSGSSGSSSSGASSASSGSGSSSTGSTGGSSTGGSGGQGCAPGHYDLDGSAANGCEVSCSNGTCTGPDGGALALDAAPPYATGAHWSATGTLVGSAQLSEPMTSAHFSAIGHVIPPAPASGQGPMTSAHFTNQTSFLGSVR